MDKLLQKKWQYLPIVVLLTSMLGGLYFIKSSLNTWVYSTVETQLKGLVSDVIYQLSKEEKKHSLIDKGEINQYINNLSQATNEKRITLIDVKGVVLADTSLQYSQVKDMENHLARQEVKSAFESGFGVTQRYSKTLSAKMLYVAKSFAIGDNQYVLRMSMPMRLLSAMSARLLQIFFILLAITTAAFIGSTLLSHYRIKEQISKEKARQEERIHNRTIEIELLHRLANMLAACSSITETQRVIEDIVPRVLGDINGCVAMMRSSRNQLSIKLDWGEPWPASLSYAPDDCWALKKGKYHLSCDEYHNLPCNHMSEVGDDQVLCIPLTAHGNTIGILHLYFGDKSVVVDQSTLRLAFTVAEHLGLALANLTLQEKLRSQALSDPLTGLFNRRYFDEMLDNSLMTAKRQHTPISILMLDLDHFKRFNDNFGHDAGDYVLKEVSSLFTSTIGDDDVACRLGGEEFAIVAPNLGVDGALELANKVCSRVNELHLDLKGLSLGKVTVSIGVVTYPDSQVDQTTLIKYADTALYKAKDGGRNRAQHYLHINDVKTKKNASNTKLDEPKGVITTLASAKPEYLNEDPKAEEEETELG